MEKDDYKYDYQRLVSANDELNRDKNYLEDQICQLKAAKISIDKEKKTLVKDKNLLDEELDYLTNEKINLEKDLGNLQRQLKTERNLNQQMKDTVNDLGSMKNELEEKVTELTLIKGTLQSQNQTLSNNVKSLETKIDELNNEIDNEKYIICFN